MGFISRIFHINPSPARYWKNRAKEYGPRSVINLHHKESEMAELTAMQEREIFPYLETNLTGREKHLLDFGCGPGRFSLQLAKLIGGKVTATDPVQCLLDLAPQSADVEYERLRRDKIPVLNGSVDVIWSCLVLGAIKDPAETIQEMKRVLSPNGLVFIIENTAPKLSSPYWTFRSIEEYCELFKFANLKHLHDYYDVEERISILAGRCVDTMSHDRRSSELAAGYFGTKL